MDSFALTCFMEGDYSVTLGLWFSNGGGFIHWMYEKSGIQILERPTLNLDLRRSQGGVKHIDKNVLFSP